jgi:hypothetical protein
MKRYGFALALTLAFLCARPGGAGAQTALDVVGREIEGYRANRYETALILDVRPLEAQVLLDGQPIGSARELVAQAVSVTAGWHTVKIGAQGFYPYTGHFVAETHGAAKQFVVTLVPVR